MDHVLHPPVYYICGITANKVQICLHCSPLEFCQACLAIPLGNHVNGNHLLSWRSFTIRVLWLGFFAVLFHALFDRWPRRDDVSRSGLLEVTMPVCSGSVHYRGWVLKVCCVGKKLNVWCLSPFEIPEPFFYWQHFGYLHGNGRRNQDAIQEHWLPVSLLLWYGPIQPDWEKSCLHWQDVSGLFDQASSAIIFLRGFAIEQHAGKSSLSMGGCWCVTDRPISQHVLSLS